MGNCVATCGHEINHEEGVDLTIKDYSNYEKSIAYVFVCPKCAKKYEKDGLILRTGREEVEWLGKPHKRIVFERVIKNLINNVGVNQFIRLMKSLGYVTLDKTKTEKILKEFVKE